MHMHMHTGATSLGTMRSLLKLGQLICQGHWSYGLQKTLQQQHVPNAALRQEVELACVLSHLRQDLA